ncbi:unnamed protein product [Dicrocoelium dendriticum]|nr:unnamed protein product [Dicrocoelium dendriticum]
MKIPLSPDSAVVIMDDIFEHLHRMMNEMMFSGFLEPRRHAESPRDEMLREPEDDSRPGLLVPEPWMPFPFYGDLVKPDMMDRDFFNRTQRQRRRYEEDKKDVILDDNAPVDDILSPWAPPEVKKWAQSFSRRTILGPNGELTESETRIVHEPDGTQVKTTVERSPQGERRTVIRRDPSGKEETEETDFNYSVPKMIAPNPQSSTSQTTTNKSSPGVLEAIRRWYRGEK